MAHIDRNPTYTDMLMPMRKLIGSAPGKEIIPTPPFEDTERPIDAEENRILGFWTWSLI